MLTIKSFRFLPCPICGIETRTKVLPETVLIRYPLFCARCGQETLLDVVEMEMVLSAEREESDGKDKANRE